MLLLLFSSRLDIVMGQISQLKGLAELQSDLLAILGPGVTLQPLQPEPSGNLVAYLATLAIGNPVQLVHLIVDTGSSALAVSHPNCTTATKSPCTSHAFDPAYSQTFAASRISHRVVTMEYDRGRWQGSIGTDLVEIINFEDSRHKKHRHQRRDAAILVPHTNHKSLPLAPHHMGMNRSSRPLDSGLPWGQAHLIKPNSTLQFGRAVGRTPNLLAKLPWRLETGINLIEQAWSIFTFGGFDGIVGLSPRAAWLQSNRAQVLLLLSGHHSRLWLAHSSSDQPVIEARLRWAKLASATNSTVVKLLGPRNALHFRARCTQILVDSERLLVPVMPKVMKGSMLNGIDPPTTQLAMEAVFDTGTTYLLLPAVVHQALMKRLQDVVPVNKAIWEDYCVQTHPALWPPLALVLDSGAYLTLYGRHYLREHSPGLFCMGIGLSQAPNEVVIGLRAMDGRLWGFNPQQHRMMFSSVLQLDPPSTPSEVCQWLSGQLTSFAAQVKCEPVCRADLAASASYCDNLHLEIAVDHRRYRYEGVQLSWVGIQRHRAWWDGGVYVTATCDVDAYYPLQCAVVLQWGWILFGCLLSAALFMLQVIFSRSLRSLHVRAGHAAKAVSTQPLCEPAQAV